MKKDHPQRCWGTPSSGNQGTARYQPPATGPASWGSPPLDAGALSGRAAGERSWGRREKSHPPAEVEPRKVPFWVVHWVHQIFLRFYYKTIFYWGVFRGSNGNQLMNFKKSGVSDVEHVLRSSGKILVWSTRCGRWKNGGNPWGDCRDHSVAPIHRKSRDYDPLLQNRSFPTVDLDEKPVETSVFAQNRCCCLVMWHDPLSSGFCPRLRNLCRETVVFQSWVFLCCDNISNTYDSKMHMGPKLGISGVDPRHVIFILDNYI